MLRPLAACHRFYMVYLKCDFQIFFLVILFAAYNGLVFLPVLLSVAGPSDRRRSDDDVAHTEPKKSSKDVAMVTTKLNGDSVQLSEKDKQQEESEVKERLLENGEVVA